MTDQVDVRTEAERYLKEIIEPIARIPAEEINLVLTKLLTERHEQSIVAIEEVKNKLEASDVAHGELMRSLCKDLGESLLSQQRADLQGVTLGLEGVRRQTDDSQRKLSREFSTKFQAQETEAKYQLSSMQAALAGKISTQVTDLEVKIKMHLDEIITTHLDSMSTAFLKVDSQLTRQYKHLRNWVVVVTSLETLGLVLLILR